MTQVNSEPIVSYKNTKKEILEAYEKALSKLNNSNTSSNATSQTMMDEAAVKQAISDSETDVVHQLADFKIEISQYLAEVKKVFGSLSLLLIL